MTCTNIELLSGLVADGNELLMSASPAIGSPASQPDCVEQLCGPLMGAGVLGHTILPNFKAVTQEARHWDLAPVLMADPPWRARATLDTGYCGCAGAARRVRSGQVGDDRVGRFRGKTSRDARDDECRHRASTNLAPDGTRCRGFTMGLLRRRPVTALYLPHVGK
jgi:hypothetical protein